MFSLDDIFDFVLRNLWLVLGLLGFAVRMYSQYVEASKQAGLEREVQQAKSKRREHAESYEGYLERTSPTKIDDGRDDFSQTGKHNGPESNSSDSRGFDDLARDLQQARTQTSNARDPQGELRRLLEEKMGRASKTASDSTQHTQSPQIGRPGSKPRPVAQRTNTQPAFEPDRTAASTFVPSSVSAPKSLEQNRVIEASFERSLNSGIPELKPIERAQTRANSRTVFSSQDAVRAVIWSEVIGTPKSKRR